MTENVENLIIEHLRAIRGTLEVHGQRLTNIEQRLTSIEQQIAGYMETWPSLFNVSMVMAKDWIALSVAWNSRHP